ncbi:hypothetical protein SAMN05421688_0581 [Poseidonocella pacifica]|uniref:Regulatory protein SoxS n=2 Tax=Poseidonocella pacifica TaxID=871651 RepID=A0A1I0VF73_9RHOB|nr:hypothetical protein SAMN05421688_0581 [Poseidonocella pacifica]
MALALSLPGLAAAVELVMVEERGCIYCAKFNAEIAPAYPNTPEGVFAPLRRVEVTDIPDGLQIVRPIRFTPTFLLVDENVEMARIEGYPGDTFFWPLFAEFLREHTDFDTLAGSAAPDKGL